MPRQIKKAYILKCILFGMVLIFVGSPVFFAKSRYGQLYILAKVNKIIPGQIFWKAADFSLLSGKFQFNDLTLKGPEGTEFVNCKNLYLNFSWLDLLKKELGIQMLVIEEPRVTIKTDQDGRLNLIDAFTDPDHSVKDRQEEEKINRDHWFGVVIHSFQLKRGVVHYKHDKEFTSLIQDIEISASGNLLKQSGKLLAGTGKVSVESPDFQIGIDQTSISMKLSGDQIDPLAIRIITPYSDMTLSGSVNNLFTQIHLDLSLDSKVMLSQLKEDFSLEQNLTGKLVGQIKVIGVPDDPEIRARFNYSGGYLSGVRFDQIDLDMDLEDKRLIIRNLLAGLASGDIKAKGNADLSSAFSKGFLSPERDMDALSYSLNVKSQGIPLENLFEKDMGINGDIAADLSVSGRGIDTKSLEVDFDLGVHGQNLAANNSPHTTDFSMKATGALKNGKVSIGTIKARAGDISLDADSMFDLVSGRMAANLSLEALDVSQTLTALGLEGVNGELSIISEITGSLSKKNPLLGGKASLKARNINAYGVKIGDVNSTLRLKDGKLYIDQAELSNGSSNLTASGFASLMGQNSLQLLKEPEFALDLKGKSIFLEDFFEKQKGELMMDSHLEGRLKHPEGFIRLQGTDFDFGVQKVSEIKAYAKLDGQKVKVDQLEVFFSPDDIIQGTGWFSFEKEYEFALSSPEIDLKYLDLIKDQDIAKGKGSIEISGKGTLPDAEISGEIRLSDLAVQGKNMDDFLVTLEVKDQLVKTMANIPGVGLKGEYHLIKKDLAASLALNEADLGIYFNIAGRPDYSGNATGTLNVYGNISDVDNLQGAAEFSKLEIFYKEKRFLFSRNVSADLKEKELSIPGIHFTVFQEEGVQEGILDIKGEGKLDGDLDFLINGHFPLQLVSLFVEDIYDFDGGLLLSANIAGTRHKPDIRADIELQDVAFTIPKLYQKLHKTNGQVKITPNAIVIDHVEGRLDTGKFNLNGKIELDALRPSAISAKFAASSLPVNIPDTLDLIINTELTMQGTSDNTRLQGEVVLLEGEYYKDFNVNLSMFREAIQKRREEKPLRSKITWAFLKNAALDIYVRYRNPFIVNNNIAQLDITHDLRIKGSMNNPIIKGRANLEYGTVTYQKRTFVVDRGVLYFLNPQTNEPTVDIQSHAKIKHYTVRLGISGTPNNLVFKPEGWDDNTNEKLTHEDIVSLIMFGTTSLERVQGEGGVLQSSSQMLSQLISTTFGEDIKKATGLDILEIESSAEDSSTDSDSIKVTIGKDLSRRMTLKYGVETKEGGSNQQAIAEYKFLEYILLNGFQDTEGNFGTELQFKLEFR